MQRKRMDNLYDVIVKPKSGHLTTLQCVRHPDSTTASLKVLSAVTSSGGAAHVRPMYCNERPTATPFLMPSLSDSVAQIRMCCHIQRRFHCVRPMYCKKRPTATQSLMQFQDSRSVGCLQTKSLAFVSHGEPSLVLGPVALAMVLLELTAARRTPLGRRLLA